MADSSYHPVPHDHEAFLGKALKRKGFGEAYAALADEYALARELLAARSRTDLTQEEVAASMDTAKKAVLGLGAVGRHSPSIKTPKKYARAVLCDVETRLVLASRAARIPRSSKTTGS